MREVITALPSRVKQGAAWVGVNPSLRRIKDGRLAPVAVEDPVEFSDGGSGPLVTLGSGADRLAVEFPGSLPVPVVSGASATYHDVYPDVDLTLTATDSGFTERLMVNDPAAGERLLSSPPSFTYSSPSLHLRQGTDGALTAIDADGHSVYSGPSPMMWAAGDSVGAGSTARVGVRLDDTSVTLLLDRAMIEDPTADYPLTVDPSFTANLLNWTDVLSQDTSGGNVSFWNGQNEASSSHGPVMVGYYPYYNTGIARAFFQMNTSSVNGKHILGATFRITENWANNCTPEPVQLWETGGISPSTTFNNQPGWTRELSSQTVAKGWSSSCASGQVAFDATAAAVDAAANKWPNLTLGLRAQDESDQSGWKRFLSDASLQVDYNSISTVGVMSTSPATSCVSGGASPASNDPYINSPTPTLTAYADDADTSENDLKGDFVWQSWNGSAWVASGSGTDPIARAANTQTSYTLPSGALADGTTYRWQVRIADPLMSPYSGTDYSAWSAWCEFTADFNPPAAPAVSSSTYTSGCSPCGGVGTTGAFTISDTSSDVTGYTWGLSDPPTVHLSPSAQGGSVSFSWTPTHGGPTTVYVQATDVGGNNSAITQYTFTVAAPSPMLDEWLLQDPAGSTSLSDVTNQHPATLGSGSLGPTNGRIVGLGGLHLNGTSDYAAAPHLLDTAQSYTVSTWVKLDSGPTGYQGILSEQGNVVSPFALQFDGPDCGGCFNFSLAQTDTTDAPTTAAWTGPVKAGVWYNLTAVFDAASGNASLYLDGRLAGTTSSPVTAPWDASGGFQIGRTFWDGGYNHVAGAMSDVRVWQRVLQPSEILALVDPSVSGLVENNTFDQTWQCGSVTLYTVSTDSSNAVHDLALQGTAQVTPAAGYENTGLALDGTGGYADTSADPDPTCDDTSAQVLHTDQSFTVSARVRLDGTALPTGARTALSQVGTDNGAFYLGYRYNGANPYWDFEMTGGDGASGSIPAGADAWSANPVTTADLGKWHQLTGVFDASAGSYGTLTLYLDGSQVGTVSRTTPAWDATGALMVGAAEWTPAGGSPGVVDYWPGAIDDVRAYQGVLTAPAASWTLSGCPGSPAACPDASGFGHPATLSASGAGVATEQSPDSQPGTVLEVDGASGYASTSAPVIDTTQSFTVGAWVDPATLSSSGSHVIVSQSGNNKSFFELTYDADAKQVCFAVFGQDQANATRYAACGPNLTAGQWMYAAGVYNEAQGTIQLYTGTLGSPLTPSATVAFTSPWFDTGMNAQVRIGAGYNGGANATAYFGGFISDVQIYPGALAGVSALM